MSQTLGIENAKLVVNEVNEAIKKSILAIKDGVTTEDFAVIPAIVGNIMKIFNNLGEARAELKDLTLDEIEELTIAITKEVFETLKAVK